MITCPKCGELNGENATNCYRCKTHFGPKDNYKKICQKCKTIYSSRTEFCEKCGILLSVYSDDFHNLNSPNESSGCWMYVIAVLIPIVGIILGCIYVARKEDEIGKWLIITSLASSALLAIFLMVFSQQ